MNVYIVAFIIVGIMGLSIFLLMLGIDAEHLPSIVVGSVVAVICLISVTILLSTNSTFKSSLPEEPTHICMHCEKVIESDVKYCPNCGTHINTKTDGSCNNCMEPETTSCSCGKCIEEEITAECQCDNCQ